LRSPATTTGPGSPAAHRRSRSNCRSDVCGANDRCVEITVAPSTSAARAARGSSGNHQVRSRPVRGSGPRIGSRARPEPSASTCHRRTGRRLTSPIP
jgi:hypothetical protein